MINGFDNALQLKLASQRIPNRILSFLQVNKPLEKVQIQNNSQLILQNVKEDE